MSRAPRLKAFLLVAPLLAFLAIFFLWHKDTSAYLRGTWVPAADEEPVEA